MKRLFFSSVAFLMAVGLCTAASAQELATVNGEPVTVKDMREQFVKRHGGHEKFLGGESEAMKFLNIVIDWRLLIQEAYAIDLQNDPKVKGPTEEFRATKADEYLLKTEILDKGQASAQEVLDAWKTRTTELYLTKQIVTDTRAEAEEVRAGILSGGSFESLARDCSISQSKMYGGQLAQFGWGVMEPRWEEAVFKLEPGMLSDIIPTKDGWQIVMLQSRDTVAPPDFDKAKGRIEEIIKKRKIEEAKTKFSAFLWEKYHAEFVVQPLSRQKLIDILRTAPDTVLAKWDGGTLTAKEFASGADIHAIASGLPGRAEEEIESQLRATVNDPLVRLESMSRKTAEVAEVADAVKRYQEDLMEGVLYDDHVLKGLTVSDDDVKGYYEKHKAELVKPEQRHVYHIVVASQDEAKKLREQLMNGEDFAKLVKTKSLDTASAKMGGELGWISKKDVPKEFAEVLTMNPGDISQPLKSKFGWHLIKLGGIESEHQMTLDEAKADISKTLLEKRKHDKREEWIKQLRAAADIKVNKAGIKKFIDSEFLK